MASKLITVLAPGHDRGADRREGDPEVLAGLARGRMRVKDAAPVEALTGKLR